MKQSVFSVLLAIVVALGVLCWWAHKAPTMPSGQEAITQHLAQATTSPNQYVPSNLLLGTDSSAALSAYLIGYNGMAVYAYSQDTAGVSTCTGACATNWPPYSIASADTANALRALESPISGTAGTITRADGSLQVTYNGKPLYFYIGDTKSGDTHGNLADHAAWGLVKP